MKRLEQQDAKEMLKIWGRKTSVNVQKVMWAIVELDVAHERIDAGGPFGGTDTAQYGALNPNRLVPTMEDGAFVLWESNAITRYVAAKYGTGTLMPGELAQRGLVDQWIDWSATTLAPDIIGVCFVGLIRTAAAERNGPAIEAAARRSGSHLGILDAQLAMTPFIVGQRLTAADIVVGAFMYRYFNLSIERPDLPNIRRWYRELTDRPAYRNHVMIDFESMKVPGA